MQMCNATYKIYAQTLLSLVIFMDKCYTLT